MASARTGAANVSRACNLGSRRLWHTSVCGRLGTAIPTLFVESSRRALPRKSCLVWRSPQLESASDFCHTLEPNMVPNRPSQDLAAGKDTSYYGFSGKLASLPSSGEEWDKAFTMLNSLGK